MLAPVLMLACSLLGQGHAGPPDPAGEDLADAVRRLVKELDAGELAQIQAGKSLPAGSASPPAGNISRDFIRYLYRLRSQSGQGDL